MAPLNKSNKYLRDPAVLDKIVEENTTASSAFEGAHPRSLVSRDSHVDKRSRIASSKNSRKS